MYNQLPQPQRSPENSSLRVPGYLSKMSSPDKSHLLVTFWGVVMMLLQHQFHSGGNKNQEMAYDSGKFHTIGLEISIQTSKYRLQNRQFFPSS